MSKPGAINARSFHIGVDLGQRVDHTAFVVLEQQIVCSADFDRVSYEYFRQRRLGVRLIERIALGTGFHKVADELDRLSKCDELKDGPLTISIDATGLGSVVTEDLQRLRPRGELFPVEITGGRINNYHNGFFSTPRTELLRAVERAFEQRDLFIPSDLPMWRELCNEMKAMRKLHSHRGPSYETYGKHDDLVFALALALFGVRMRELPTNSQLLRTRRGY